MSDQGAMAGTVDVIIPMRNGASTVLATLASVYAQTVQPRRIIVVDDGSTDDGAELVRGRPLVELIRTAPLGVSHARNTGLKAAGAEFVAPLDCDDLWRPRKLECQLAVAFRHPEAALITCDQIGATPSGVLLPARQARPRFEGLVLQRLLENCFLLGGWSSSMLVRRDAALEVGGYDEERRFFEDIDFCFALAARYPFAICPEILTYVVENPSSTTRRTTAADFVLEMTLQGLMVVEKWIAASDSPSRLAHEAARHILSKFLRNGLSPRYLPLLRTQMAEHTPVLAARIARNTPHMAVCLARAGVLGFGHIVAGARRHLGSKSAGLKPLAALAPQAETIA